MNYSSCIYQGKTDFPKEGADVIRILVNPGMQNIQKVRIWTSHFLGTDANDL